MLVGGREGRRKEERKVDGEGKERSVGVEYVNVKDIMIEKFGYRWGIKEGVFKFVNSGWMLRKIVIFKLSVKLFRKCKFYEERRCFFLVFYCVFNVCYSDWYTVDI